MLNILVGLAAFIGILVVVLAIAALVALIYDNGIRRLIDRIPHHIRFAVRSIMGRVGNWLCAILVIACVLGFSYALGRDILK